MAETAITTVLAKVAELVAWEAAVLLEVGDHYNTTYLCRHFL